MGPFLAALALLALFCGSTGAVSLAVEHSLDGVTFTPGGHIVFEDDVLAGQGGAGSLIRSGTPPTGNLGTASFYSLRVSSGASAGAVLASLPARCWAASGFATPLTLTLLGDGHLAGVSFDLSCSAAGVAAAPVTPPAVLPSEQPVVLRFPGKAPDVKQQAAIPTPEQKKAETSEAVAAVEDDETLTPAARAALKKKLEDENKTWLQKNWIMLVPAGLISTPTAENPLVSRFDSGSSSDLSSLADTVLQTLPGSFTGDGTAFSEAVNNTGAAFACSFRYLNNWASQYFVAMNNEQWNDGLVCGSCVRARCVDSKCPIQGVDVVAMVVDKCPECSYGDVDFSYPAYTAVTGSWPNRLKVSWEWVDCSSFIDGTIKMWPKDGVNSFWQAFYFANAKYQIQSITLNGTPLVRQTFGFWIHAATAPTGPCELSFTAVNGAVVNATLNSVFEAQDLDIQFPVQDSVNVAVAGR